MKIPRFEFHVGEVMAAIDEVAGYYMDHVLIGFHDAFDHQQLGFQQGIAASMLGIFPYHHVGIAGFILERDKNHARGRAWPLAPGDDAGDADETSMAHFGEFVLALAALKYVVPLAQQLHGMTAERQSGAVVVSR